MMWRAAIILTSLTVLSGTMGFEYCTAGAGVFRPGYPTFDPGRLSDDDVNILWGYDDHAFIYPGDAGSYTYRNNHYQRLMISVNGYIALLDDYDQPMPHIRPFRGNMIERDMINLFYAGTDTTGCQDTEVSWRISDNQTDKDIFSAVINDAEGSPWEPDYMIIVTYTEVDMDWVPCCFGYYYYSYYWDVDEKRSILDAKENARELRERESRQFIRRDSEKEQNDARNDQTGPNNNERRTLKDLHRQSRCSDHWECFNSVDHERNSYQMALATKAINGSYSETYVIFDYGHIGWVDYEPSVGTTTSQAGFTQKQSGSRYDFFGSFNLGMFDLPLYGWPYPGVYAFRLDTWGPQCDPAPGWFIQDFNHSQTGYWYDNPSCDLWTDA